MAPKTPLLDPEGYFSDRYDSFSAGAGVFVIYTVMSVVMVYAVMRMLLSQIDNAPAGLESEAMSALVPVLFISLIFFVIGWLIVAGIMHVLSGGDGSFTDALGVAGWAYAPEVITAPLTLGIAYVEVQQYSFDGSDPQQLAGDLEAIDGGTGALPLLLLTIVTAWSVYILAKGVAATHDVAVGNALIPAVIIGLGSFLLTLL